MNLVEEQELQNKYKLFPFIHRTKVPEFDFVVWGTSEDINKLHKLIIWLNAKGYAHEN